MRICILQSAFPEDHAYSKSGNGMDPALYTDQHKFEDRWIQKDSAKEQIDAAVAEKFDFYFNFMWGQEDDEFAGVEACRYVESLGLPVVGANTKALLDSKIEFYKNAQALGYPRVPGTSNYPLFVKPSLGFGSALITEKCLCQDRDELLNCLEILNEALQPTRKSTDGAAESLSPSTVVDGIPIPDDIVVQEFIQGWDYIVEVIEMGDYPVALSPEKYVYPKHFRPGRDFLHADMRFHPETGIRVLTEKENPVLFRTLQEMAVQAFKANNMRGQTWAQIDIRVPESSEPAVIDANPMGNLFCTGNHKTEDIAVEESFPGGHRAFINSVISSQLIQLGHAKPRQAEIAEAYTAYSHKYKDSFDCRHAMDPFYEEVILSLDLPGAVLELGSGTGKFGRLLKHGKQSSETLGTLAGIELSPGMIQLCQQTNAYSELHQGPVEEILPPIDACDHIVSFFTLFHLSPEIFSMVMARSFQLARKSIAITVDEITEGHNRRLEEMGSPFSSMKGFNHSTEMQKTFCHPPPRGWKLVKTNAALAWSFPEMGCDIQSTLYVFETQPE